MRNVAPVPVLLLMFGKLMHVEVIDALLADVTPASPTMSE